MSLPVHFRKKAALAATLAVFACGGVMTVSAETETSAEDEYKATLVKTLSENEQRGDLNKDGIINVFDLIRYKNSIIEDKDPGAGESVDANSDGELNGKDISAVKNDILKKSKIWSYKSMPKMDGSTSAIPLEAGLKSKMLGVSYSDAKQLVSHHKTHESFQMLLSGENDMIFTVPISEDQKKAADKAGVKLNFVPVAKEGFVFVVNKSNPVDSLTSAQIRDIYSGKITNWKEVGGKDEEIVPYQRNKDSGSQNYMTEFMEGYDLMDPPKTYVLGSMSSLMDGLAVYDNAENAIGYSVYSYAAQMYENSSDTKFIAVDGIKPTRETMADGTYPLLSSTSIVYTDKASQNTKDFAAWAVSEEGQATVLASGYVPVKDMEYPDELKPYSAKGTGKEKPADYKPAEKYSVFGYARCSSGEDGRILRNGDCFVYFLKDKDLENMINKDIENIVFGGKDYLTGYWEMNVTVLNGFMNISFRNNILKIDDYVDPVYLSDHDIELNYDLRTGKRIEKFSDLFYKDTDFVPLVSQTVGEFISIKCPEFLKTDYIGMLGDVSQFSFTSVRPAAAGTYFDKESSVPFQSQYDYELIDSMVIGEYFDCKEIIPEGLYGTAHDVEYQEWIDGYTSGSDGELHYNYTSRFHTEEEINERNQTLEKLLEKTRFLYAKVNPEHSELTANHMSVSFEREIRYGSGLNAVITYVRRGSDQLPYSFIFDSETLENISISDIFGETFEKYNGGAYNIRMIDLAGGTVELYDKEYKKYIENIDFDKLNMKYIMPEKAMVTERKWRKNAVIKGGEDRIVQSFPETYVLNYGAKENYLTVSENTEVKIVNMCRSHGKSWCECWDAVKEDQYYGWIPSENVIADFTEEEQAFYEKYLFHFFDDHPLEMYVNTENVINAYTDEYITERSVNKEIQYEFTEYYGIIAKTKCLSHGAWWYECWDAKDGTYYGWIRDKDLSYNYDQLDPFNGKYQPIKLDKPVECTILGKTFGGVSGYADSFIVDYDVYEPLITTISDDVQITAKALCYSHGELWYCIVAEGTPDGYFWVNASYIEEN